MENREATKILFQLTRREFMKRAACGAVGAVLIAMPTMAKGAFMVSTTGSRPGMDKLISALEASDPAGAERAYRECLEQGAKPRDVHKAIFPAVQRVLNPPYINPHLPKMYGINHEFLPDLDQDGISSLVGLEIEEYARRPRLEPLPPPVAQVETKDFKDIAKAVRDNDREKAAGLMAGYSDRVGLPELARNLLLLGSGYLDRTLGHSISCTAFILLEMMRQNDQDLWPAYDCLAHYFCEGGFQVTPSVGESGAAPSGRDMKDAMLRATSGTGIVNLHHTITFYAAERVRHLLSEKEYAHLLGRVISFMGEKKPDPVSTRIPEGRAPAHYEDFREIFGTLNSERTVSALEAMRATRKLQADLGRYLIKGVCGLHQGRYDPHYLTGIGSLLWVLEKYPEENDICRNGLFQYLDFFFSNVEVSSRSSKDGAS